MAKVLLGCLLLALISGSQAGSPVQKVIELLQENRIKVQKDLEAEGKEMAEYATFCDDESKDRGYAIQTATRKIQDLEAAIQNGDAQMLGLNDELVTLGTEMGQKERQLAAANAERKMQRSDFQATEKELDTAVDQLQRAVNIIKREMSFVQVVHSKGSKAAGKQRRKDHSKDVQLVLSTISKMLDAAWVGASNKKSLQGLLQTQTDAAAAAAAAEDSDSDLTLNQPQAAIKNYESASGGIVDQIEEMKGKAEETLSGARKTEMKMNHNFNMMKQSLETGLKVLQEKTSDAKHSLSTRTEENGLAKGALVESKASKAADEEFLASLTVECNEAHASWALRQESSNGELSAIDKAKEILTAGVRVFVQLSGKTSTVKHLSDDLDDDDSDKTSDTRKKVVNKLKELSKTFRSYALMEMVTRANSDPFEKVRGLIESMIDKLLTEANDEATQKGFCDEEIGKSQQTQGDKSMTLDKLRSRIDKAASTTGQLQQSVKELESEIAALDKMMSAATKIRQESHATYVQASADFRDASEAVSQAIGVLKEYYESALVQTGSAKKNAQPDFGGAKSDAAHSIISILEMSAENFTKMLMEVETGESEGAADYKRVSAETRVSKAAKSAEVKASLSEIKSLDVALKNSQEDADMTQKEIDAVMAYLDKLKPQCETKVMSYAENKQRREGEIDGLKEALSILDAPAASLVQLRGTHRHSA